MATSFIDILAAVLGVVLALSPIPQIRLILQRKSSADVSLGMFYVIFLGCSTWLLYGIAHRAPSIIIAQTVGVSVAVLTIVIIHRYRNAPLPE